MEPCVTIIVPIYNAEATLRRCVESVLGQEFADFELILADDGSKDGSGALCDAFAQSDSRVRVIHKENSGVSDTRNQAMDQGVGDAICNSWTPTIGSRPMPPSCWSGPQRSTDATWWCPISTG